MRKPVLAGIIGATVGLTVALIFLNLNQKLDGWALPALPVILGIISAGFFVRLYYREPPSLERFEWLSGYGAGCVVGLVLGLSMAIARLLADDDARLRIRILMGSVTAVMVGMLVFVVWHRLAVQKYSHKSSHPDYAEDAEGNPVRHPEADLSEPQ
jgi:hypothetical protein